MLDRTIDLTEENNQLEKEIEIFRKKTLIMIVRDFKKLEERIRILEDKALLCGNWPENVTDLLDKWRRRKSGKYNGVEERAENIRKGGIGEVMQRSLDDAIESGAGGSGNIIIEEDSDGE
jgi:hypothetical protein